MRKPIDEAELCAHRLVKYLEESTDVCMWAKGVKNHIEGAFSIICLEFFKQYYYSQELKPKEEKKTLFDDLKVHDISIEGDNSLGENIVKVISRRFQKLEAEIDKLKEGKK